MNSVLFKNFHNLKGNWHFRFDLKNNFFNDTRDYKNKHFPCTVSVPGYWDDYRNELLKQYDSIDECLTPVSYWEKNSDIKYNNFTYLKGTGTYMNTFRLPEIKPENRVIFVLSEVLYNVKLYINSKFVCLHFGHRSMKKIDITDYVIPDSENRVILSVNNEKPDKTACPYPDGFCGGILGTVGFYITGKACLSNCFCYLSENKLKFEISLLEPFVENAVVKYTISKNDRVVSVGECALQSVFNNFYVKKPDLKLWHPGNSNLYHVKYQLFINNTLSDEIMIKTGFRHLHTYGRKIMFNEKPVYIRSNCYSNHYPNNCSVPYEKNYHVRQLNTLLKLGFNSAKYLYSFPPQVCLDYADEIGMPIMISVDIRPKSVYDDNEYEKALLQIKEYINSIKHHPCVSVIRLSGESYCYDFYTERLKGIYDVIKQCSPEILVLPSHAPLGADYGININDKDTYDYPYLRNVRLFRKMLKCTDVVGHYPNGILSYSCPGDSNWKQVDNMASVYDRPMISHELGMKGSYIDIRKKGQYTSRLPQKYVYDLINDLKENNILDRAEKYYKMSCLVQQKIRKFCIEETRLCRSLAGYEYLGAFDHFSVMSYPCGFTDEYMQLKYGDSFSKNRMFQKDTVIILDYEDRRIRCFSSGEDFNGIWTVSHFGQKDIEESLLTVELIKDNKVIQSNRKNCGYIPNGKVCSLTPCSIKWPDFKQPAKITVKATLKWDNKKTSNMWDFYIFPKTSKKTVTAKFMHNSKQILSRFVKCIDNKKSHVAFTTLIDYKCIQHMKDGGKLVVLGDGGINSFPIQYALATGHSSRKKANVGTCVNKHHLTDDIPNDGYAGWQFYPMMTEKTKAIIFDNSIAFDPVIEVISADKEVKKQGILFEYQLANGKLLLFSGDMINDNPAVHYFLNRLINYINGDLFNPKLSITANQLLSMRKQPVKADEIYNRQIIIKNDKSKEYKSALEFKKAGQSERIYPVSSGLADNLDNASQDYAAGAGSQQIPNIGQKTNNINNLCTVDAGISKNTLFIYFKIQKSDLFKQDGLIYPDRGSGLEKLNLTVKYEDNSFNFNISHNPEGAFVSGPFDLKNRIKVGKELTENVLKYDIVYPLKPEAIDAVNVDITYTHKTNKTEKLEVEVFKFDIIM